MGARFPGFIVARLVCAGGQGLKEGLVCLLCLRSEQLENTYSKASAPGSLRELGTQALEGLVCSEYFCLETARGYLY